MGTNDLAKELQAVHVPGRQPLLTALASSACSAPAPPGKVILDGVYNDIKDHAGFHAECEQGRDGLRRQDADPPEPGRGRQRLFAPTAEAVDEARALIAAFDAAAAEGRGVVTVDGRMIENLHVDNARRVLAVADAIAANAEA